MEDIITNFELKNTRLLRVCPACNHVQDKTFELNREGGDPRGTMSDLPVPLPGYARDD